MNVGCMLSKLKELKEKTEEAEYEEEILIYSYLTLLSKVTYNCTCQRSHASGATRG